MTRDPERAAGLPDRVDIVRRIHVVFVRSLALNLDPEVPAPPLDLLSIAGLDSLSILEFVAGLEHEFQIAFEPERLNMEFLGDLTALTDYVCERLRAPC